MARDIHLRSLDAGSGSRLFTGNPLDLNLLVASGRAQPVSSKRGTQN